MAFLQTAPVRTPWAVQQEKLWALLGPTATFLAALAALLLLRHLFVRWMRRRVRGEKSFLAVALDTLWFPSLLWCLAGAMAVSLRFAELTPTQMQWAAGAIVTFIIVSLTLVVSSVAVRMISVYGERQGMPFAMAGLSRTLTRVLVLAIGAMTLLAYLGLSITPLVTALGVTGLAVALALQDTLTNFFAGVHILVERPIFVGDFIKLEGGEEGVVTDIGWRTTRLRTGANNVVVIPNTKITSGILVNYSLPDRRVVVELAILVAHEADAGQVCRIALEEAAQVEGVLQDPPPMILCDPGVLPTHVQFKLLVHVENRLMQGLVQSAIRLRLLSRFRAEGVPPPAATKLLPVKI